MAKLVKVGSQVLVECPHCHWAGYIIELVELTIKYDRGESIAHRKVMVCPQCRSEI